MNKVDLREIVGGALQEKFGKSFEKIIENLQDQNTSFKVKRGITITLKFEQNEKRDDVSVSVDVQEKLAPQAGIKTSFSIGKDLETGELFAREYGKQIKGQMNIEDYTEKGKSVSVDTETGEITENDTVVDFRRAAK